ncbi:MAG: DUF6440 family protein [Candidatus Weimeria sp.]
MSKDKRFEVKEKESQGVMAEMEVIVDKDTGVNYLFVHDGYAGGLTVMVDADGKPIVTK